VLPPALQVPPPRELAAAPELFEKARSRVRRLLVGAMAVPLLVFALFWLNAGHVPIGWFVGISVLVCAIVLGTAVAFMINGRLAEALFREGLASVGVIREARTAMGSEGHDAWVTLRIEFRDTSGRTLSGQLTTLARQGELDCHTGARVPVLWRPADPKRFAIYTPGTGMAVGVVV
jgi:hypothetical protein